MERLTKRGVIVGVLVSASLVLGAGVAAAVSDGNYRPAKQHCSSHADDTDRAATAQPGCQAATVNLSDGAGHEAGYAGVQQTPDGTEPSELVSGGDPSTFDPTSGAQAYFGADDNLDNGEHDGSEQIGNGPSDGGSMVLDVDPASVARWAEALQSGDLGYLLIHPTPLVGAGAGGCADGACASVQTQRRTAYQGTKRRASRDVADYDGKQWDPESCAGPSDTKADCGGRDISYWAKKEGSVYVEPGAQVYEDPDPQGSPVGPYPLPAAYVGTCGLIVGGGTAPALPASPLTNSAGQLDLATGC